MFHNEFYQAIKNNNKEKVQQLINSGNDVNSRITGKNDTPLIIACYFGHPDIIKLLMDNNASLNITNDDGETPLYIAKKYAYRFTEE